MRLAYLDVKLLNVNDKMVSLAFFYLRKYFQYIENIILYTNNNIYYILLITANATFILNQ